jgi:hypothetical protein
MDHVPDSRSPEVLKDQARDQERFRHCCPSVAEVPAWGEVPPGEDRIIRLLFIWARLEQPINLFG